MIDEFHGGFRRAGGGVAHGDVESADVPILRVEERIEIEQPHDVAPRGGLLILGHRGRQLGLEIAPDDALVLERHAFGFRPLTDSGQSAANHFSWAPTSRASTTRTRISRTAFGSPPGSKLRA